MKRLLEGISILLVAGLMAQSAWAADVQINGNGTLTAKMAFNGRVAIVAKTGGDYTSPATAMTNYSTWCPSPLQTNPCLLKIMPGFYDIGTSSVIMQSFIDIEGSGENVTMIQGSINSATAGVVNGATNAELRFLSVENAGDSSANAIAIYNYTAYSQKLTQVTVSAGYATNNYGVYNYESSPVMTNVNVNAWGGTTAYGVYNAYSSYPTMNNVNITASGGSGNSYGVYNSQSSPAITNSTVDGNTGMGGTHAYGVYNVSSSGPAINQSTVYGETNSLYNNSGCSFDVAHSKLTGGVVVANGGTFGCVGVYVISPSTQRYTAITSCP
jgi:hypothetical protein